MTTTENTLNLALLRQAPQILRARGFRLYTKCGRRLIDLWLNGGAAVLGHTPPNFLRELKNTASRGLYAPLPHFYERRYIKALSALLPDYSFRLYAAPPQKLAELYSSGKVKTWRPFSSCSPLNDHYLLLVLPGILTWRDSLPLGLCVAACSIENDQMFLQLPSNDILPPVLLAAAARGVYDLIASPMRAKPVLPRTFKALHANPLWKRRGIYLYLNNTPSLDDWAALNKKFLEAGFLIPPSPLHPVILPGELSQGEDAKLAKILLETTFT